MHKLNDRDLLHQEYVVNRKHHKVIAEELGVGLNTVIRALERFGLKKADRFPEQFTLQQKSALYGSLLGDANLTIQPGGTNACLRMEHSIKQTAWLKWKFDTFKPWINHDEPSLYASRMTKGINCPSIKFCTVATPLFTEAYHMFYKDNGKIVSPEILKRIDALALAVWYQDDGSFSHNITNNQSILKLATNGFPYAEQLFVIDWFKHQYGLEFYIAKDNQSNNKTTYHLNLRPKDFDAFINIIRPHVIPEMAYKLDPHAKASF